MVWVRGVCACVCLINACVSNELMEKKHHCNGEEMTRRMNSWKHLRGRVG